jgi:hypothetical protein
VDLQGTPECSVAAAARWNPSERKPKDYYSSASFSIYDGHPQFGIVATLSRALMQNDLPRAQSVFHSQQGSTMVFIAATGSGTNSEAGM